MAAIYQDSLLEFKPIPRSIGKFLLEQQQNQNFDEKEIQESQFLELGWTYNKQQRLQEYERGADDSPLKEYLPKVERMNIYRLVRHARHKI